MEKFVSHALVFAGGVFIGFAMFVSTDYDAADKAATVAGACPAPEQAAPTEESVAAAQEAQMRIAQNYAAAKRSFDADLLEFKNRAVHAGHAEWRLNKPAYGGMPTVEFQWLYNFDPTKEPTKESEAAKEPSTLYSEDDPDINAAIERAGEIADETEAKRKELQ